MAEALRITPLRMPDPTEQQRRASDPAASVWVNASAGSGKTTVLTKRVVRLLLSGVPPQRILCLTFTRAAAAEMALRVTRQLSQWAICSDNELGESLSDLQGHAPPDGQMDVARRLFAQVLACPGGMRIRTIHSFGQEILRRFPVEAGLPPHFSVIEESDALTLQQDALLEMLKYMSSGALAEDIKFLICELGEKGFMEAMRAMLHERAHLQDVLADTGGMEALIEHIRRKLDLQTGEGEASILREAFGTATFPEKDIRQITAWFAEGTPTYIKRGEQLQAWLALEAEARVGQFESYCRCFLKKDGDTFATYGDKKLLAAHPELDTLSRREAERLKTICERLEAAEIAMTTAAVMRTGMELTERYQVKKQLQAALDYDDLIIRTNALISRPGIAPWVLFKLDGGLDHILVDEAQDTSRAQWNIVRVLADEFFAGRGAHDGTNRTLFVVGDEKQSIFSFQNADPEAFAEMRGFFQRRILNAEKTFLPLSLSVSFRSAPAVLKAVDTVFAADDVRQGVSHEPVMHTAFGRSKPGRVEVWPLLTMPEKDESQQAWVLPLGYEAEHDTQAELASRIAGQIHGWLKNKIPLPGENQPISPGDIMILLRRRGRFADLMVRALKQHDVPVTGVDRMHLIRQLPVMDLLALIRFALLPEDDLNLATVLRGPLLNVSEETLMRLAIRREGTLWQNLLDKGPREAYDYLSRLLAWIDTRTPFTILTHILNEPCPGSVISGRQAIWSRLGPDALDPIEELLNAAQNFGRHHPPSLQSFLQWLTISDMEIKRELDHGAGQVRIMTVHASKGLEAPIVFLPDTTGVPRSTTVPKLLWANDETPLYLARRPGSGAARDTWNEARKRQLEEYRRLMYVALTRAARQLIIAGWEARKEEKAEASWYSLIQHALHPLHEVAMADGRDIVVFADAVLRDDEAKEKVSTKPLKRVPLPEWAVTPPSPEPEALRHIVPSRLAMLAVPVATPDAAYGRGRIIHRLLQSLPDAAESRRAAATKRFLANTQLRLTAEQQVDIYNEVMQLLQDPVYAPIFGPGSRAEVPLVGVIDGGKISGQIDRLCMNDDEVWIVDFKTNRPPPAEAKHAPAAYRAQLASYRAVMQAVYPLKQVRCFLLWTYGPRLMEITPDLLLS